MLNIFSRLKKEKKPERYLQLYSRKEDKFSYFGEHTKEYTYEITWYYGENKIGLDNPGSAETELFLTGFFAGDNKLFIRSGEFPCIQRLSHEGLDRGYLKVVDNADAEKSKGLIDFILDQKTTHVYVASESKKFLMGILTFSLAPPSEEIYRPWKIMPIEVRGI